MFETSFIQIEKSALKQNLGFINEWIGPDRKLSSVVKGNAYGHGIEAYIPMAEACGINHFAVYSADEAYRVMEVKAPETEIMIMGSVDDDALAWAIEHGIEVWVFEIERLTKALEHAKSIGKPARLHIEVETGMHRTGFTKSEVKAAIAQLKAAQKHFVLKGIFSNI